MSNNLYIAKLTKSHNLKNFDCGNFDLNNYLSKYALKNQQSDSSTTYIACSDDNVIGYYTLTVASVIQENAPPRISKGLPKYPIPVALLARLAVSKEFQKKGIGRGLLKNCLIRVNEAADLIGIRALLVHAKDEKVRDWYQQFDFEPSPTDPLHLFLMLKDIRTILES
nr:GNAT family N-acetyltransferase [Nostoc sp. TCL26-01]